MFYKGSGQVYIVEGTTNAQKYVYVLHDRLEPQIKEWFGGNEYLCMQDGAPSHMAKA